MEEWRLLAMDRESALAKRAARATEELTMGTRDLGKLTLWTNVRVKNQTGEKPTRWDHTGGKNQGVRPVCDQNGRNWEAQFKESEFFEKVCPLW